MKQKKEKIAYLAGIIDGEGSISITSVRKRKDGKKYRSISLSLQIGSISKQLVNWIKKNFPIIKVYHKRLLYTGKLFHIFRVTKQHELKSILSLVLPFLIIKQAQAKIVLKILNNHAKESHWTKHQIRQCLQLLRVNDHGNSKKLKEEIFGSFSHTFSQPSKFHHF